jgi:hypothetical protein
VAVQAIHTRGASRFQRRLHGRTDLRDGHGSRLYDDDLQESIQRSFSPLAVQKRGTILPYLHLPYEALLFAPLARFSYVTAYAIWLA